MSKPIYLPDVENHPQPGFYGELITAARGAGKEPWPIWHLFAFRAETTMHLAQLTQGLVRESSSLTPGFRELIATYTSHLNQCGFCTKAHAAVAAELLGDEALVSSVLEDLERSPLSEKEKALLRYVRTVTLDLPSVGKKDVETLKSVGWDDEAIYYAISVCALFNFYNRWITATGVQPVSDDSFRTLGALLARNGYDPARRLAGLRQS